MKKKIQDALEQAYAVKLGLTDKKVYARVAALGETYVAKEEDIPAFVEKAEDIIKGFQGVDDQGRTLATANAKIAELEEKLAKANTGKEGEKKGDGEGEQKPDIAKIVADAVAAAVKPIQDSLDAYKTQNSAKEAQTLAKTKFYENKWTTKFKEEADDAWGIVSELNEAKGGKMTSEEYRTIRNGGGVRSPQDARTAKKQSQKAL